MWETRFGDLQPLSASTIVRPRALFCERIQLFLTYTAIICILSYARFLRYCPKQTIVPSVHQSKNATYSRGSQH